MTDVSRILWAHGDVKCPTCSLPLDPLEHGRDHAEYVQLVGESRAFHVYGKHALCGSSFDFRLVDLPAETP